MDFGQSIIRLPTLSEVNDGIQQCINDAVERRVRQLISDIAQGEGLPAEYLHERYGKAKLYMSHINPSIKRMRKELTQAERCQARINGGSQCSRKRKVGEYCGGHSNSRPYGRMGA